MHGLNEHYAKVDLLAPVAVLGLGHLAADQASGHLDELIPAALSQCAQRRHTRKRIALVELRLVSRQPAQVSLLRCQQVHQCRPDGSISPGRGQLHLFLAQPLAYVKDVEVGPLVVTERFDQK